MKIVIINGSPRKGNTYAAAQTFKNEMTTLGNVEFTEFFLPQDLPEFCAGCMLCLEKDEQLCPHSEYTLPILEALLPADGIIFTTPVYALQTTGAVKAFFDHYAWMFVVHRARPEMFAKKAFVLSTTAGAGTRAAMKTIVTNLKFWGVNRIYSFGFALRAVDWDTVKPKRKEKFDTKLKKAAKRFYKEVVSGKKRSPYLLIKLMFHFRRGMLKKEEKTFSNEGADVKYWTEQNWFKKNPF
ncbi:MAG: NAD(P)H-dependent oxidoreductase [Oscillospiraceae bacterium]|nr:NAD(P)H-dependent oxidoreductase [Oscillospiraceae bacterium]